VDADVGLECGGLAESFLALGTNETLLSCVNACVLFEVEIAYETSPTSNDGAHEGLLSCVNSLVFIAMAEVSEALTTEGAHVLTSSAVLWEMAPQWGGIFVHKLTVGTHMLTMQWYKVRVHRHLIGVVSRALRAEDCATGTTPWGDGCDGLAMSSMRVW